MTWKERFFRFLKEEDVYGEWVYNIRKQHPIWDKKFWEGTLKAIFSEEDKCAEAINYAFHWADTRQGYNFWLKLDNKWNTKCGYRRQLCKCCGEEDFYDS